MDYYKCENCGKMFDEFEMNYRAAQVDKKCWCCACRETAQQGVQADETCADCKLQYTSSCPSLLGVRCSYFQSRRWLRKPLGGLIPRRGE